MCQCERAAYLSIEWLTPSAHVFGIPPSGPVIYNGMSDATTPAFGWHEARKQRIVQR